MKSLLPALLALVLCSCATYKMGSTPKAAGMTDLRVIYVPTAQNETDETGIPGIVTNAILQELDRDGTYRHARKDESDAILEVTVKKIERSAIRQSTQQFLTTLQFQLIITLEYRLYSMKEKKDVISKTTAIGTTTFFVQGDQTESQRQAIPPAAVSAAQAIVASLANRGW
ncbi:MAG: LptE family protein [Verrucomicrobia bacterium]|nr:LptE family protein [Verrucomicrobiota bacterium]